MAKVKIDEREYDTDTMSADAKGRLEMLVATENRLRELQREMAIMQTARNAYVQALKEALAVQGAPKAA